MATDTTRVWFEGADQVASWAASFERAVPAVLAAGEALVRKTAFDIQADAQSVVPVDTGNLKNSIGVTMISRLAAEIGPTADYGIYVEYGTSTQAPQPYMTPASDRNEPIFNSAVEMLGGTVIR